MDTKLNDDMVAAALGDLDSADLDSADLDSADPDSADPDSADPDSADPDSADPDSADSDSAVLSPATVMALRLADVLTSDTPVVTPEFKQQLGRHFSDDQILELGSALAVASGWQRFIEAFGIRPDSWTPGDSGPQRPV
jgi:alkylhydroperoxidase family enzyme